MQTILDPVLITGAARSGTSMSTGPLYLCGAYGGELAPGNRANPKGMFENSKIRNTIVKPFLRSINCDPLGQNPLPKIGVIKNLAEDPGFVSQWRKSVITVLFQHQKPTPEQVWFYKGAKMCLMWPIWHKAFPSAKWIIVRRDSEEIVASCLRTSFMRAYKNRSGWLAWVAEHEKRFEEMVEAKLDITELWPSRMVAGDFTEMQAVVNRLNLEWNRDKVVDFIDPGLWRRWKGKKPQDRRNLASII